MTRITSFGIKRTYLQAGLSEEPQKPQTSEENPDVLPTDIQTGDGDNEVRPKKKRKRTKKSQRNGGNETVTKGSSDETEAISVVSGDTDNKVPDNKEQKRPSKEGKKKKKIKLTREAASELRRQKRIAERNAMTTCFACRAKGHAAKDCPQNSGRKSNAHIVGICYRCGSAKHTLTRCRKPLDPVDPMPFASCFVCKGKGHIASACPENKERGVYPNGGACKLCGETSHLAKDCGLRKQDAVQDSILVGLGQEAGADEDDFHILKRRKTEVEREERREDKLKHRITVGAHSGVVAMPPKAPQTTKVVYF